MRISRQKSLRRLIKLLLLTFSPFAIIGCEALTEITNGGSTTPIESVANGSCYVDSYRQPDFVVTPSIDILFVTDTSGSLDIEREAIANGIDGFVSELPPEVDYRIAVMLGHSSRSNHSHKLYKYENNPYVLNSQTMSLNEIRNSLRENLTYTANDIHGDGGEEMLFSLADAFDHGNLQSSQAHGFFRENAALAIVFITDENDICYPGTVPDPDGYEATAFQRDCSGNGPGNPRHVQITAQHVMDQIRGFTKDRPFLVSGIYYSDRNNVPISGENEFGLGIHEIINLSQGVHVNMANGQFNTGLSDIGRLAVRRLQLNTTFQLSQTDVNANSITVKVDGNLVPHQYEAITNTVTIRIEDAGTALSQIEINFCNKTANCGPLGCNVNPCDIDPNSVACIEFCVANPQDPHCVVQNPCEIAPNGAACTEYCVAHPQDPLCVVQNPCDVDPNSAACTEFCVTNPQDPHCVVQNPCDIDPHSAACTEFCVANPQDPHCVVQNPCEIDPNSASCAEYCTTHQQDPLCCVGPTCGGGIGV